MVACLIRGTCLAGQDGDMKIMKKRSELFLSDWKYEWLVEPFFIVVLLVSSQIILALGFEK